MCLAGMLFSMKISDYAREHITYEMIDLPTHELNEHDIKFLRENRPSFMFQIERERSLFERW